MESKPVGKRGIHVRLSEEDWAFIQTAFCAGESAKTLGQRFGITPRSIYKRAQSGRWASPNRIKSHSEQLTVTSDPASITAAIWKQRGLETRDRIYRGATKALHRFFALNPVPQTFQEAAIAAKLANEAIEPPTEKGGTNVNLAILTSDFTPHRAQPAHDV